MACLSFFQNFFKNNSIPNVNNVETEIVIINTESEIINSKQINLHDDTTIVKWNETTKFLVPINGGKIIKKRVKYVIQLMKLINW